MSLDATIEDPRLGIGGNKPPVADQLATKYEDDIKLVDEMITAAKSVPERIDTDEQESKAAEIYKKMTKLKTRLDNTRKSEGEPYSNMVTAINGFFNTRIELVDEWRKKVNTASTEHKVRKAEAEKRRVAEEAEKKRQEEARLIALAQETERTKNEEKSALDLMMALQEEARIERDAATGEIDILRSDLAAAEAAIAQINYDNASIAHDIARRNEAGNPMPDVERAEKKLAATKRLADAKTRAMECKHKLDVARDRARKAKEDQQKADENARIQAAKVKAAERDTDQHLNAAARASTQATKLDKIVDGPIADLGRNRSEHGAVSTLAEIWKSQVIDRDLLDKNALWPFIAGDAIAVALGKWMDTQPPDKRVMRGAIMAKEATGQIR